MKAAAKYCILGENTPDTQLGKTSISHFWSGHLLINSYCCQLCHCWLVNVDSNTDTTLNQLFIPLWKCLSSMGLLTTPMIYSDRPSDKKNQRKKIRKKPFTLTDPQLFCLDPILGPFFQHVYYSPHVKYEYIFVLTAFLRSFFKKQNTRILHGQVFESLTVIPVSSFVTVTFLHAYQLPTISYPQAGTLVLNTGIVVCLQTFGLLRTVP